MLVDAYRGVWGAARRVEQLLDVFLNKGDEPRVDQLEVSFAGIGLRICGILLLEGTFVDGLSC